MRYADMAAHTVSLTAEAEELDGKKRLGKNQKARRAVIADELSLMTQTVPPATVRTPPTGERYDINGNVYDMHRRNVFGANGAGHRQMRRNPARLAIQFKRSRIQRLSRKQRTGGVR